MSVRMFTLVATSVTAMLSCTTVFAADASSAKPNVIAFSAEQSKAMQECMEKAGVKSGLVAGSKAAPTDAEKAAVKKCYEQIPPKGAEKPTAPVKEKKAEEKPKAAN